MSTSAEHRRLEAADDGREAWRDWGPYLSERAWGTVREDYSESGDAWAYLPFDHSRSRCYRWSEDGLAGLSNLNQDWCFALAFWNGRDPLLKERVFGLANAEGNHGEDAKDYWWYEDATPTGSWLSWRYHYPQGEFPYTTLREQNAARGKEESEFELVDTGIFDEDRYFIITAEYAKADPHAYAITVTVQNAGPDRADLHVLPHLWLRNMWSWGRAPDIEDAVDAGELYLHGAPGRLSATHPHFGTIELFDAEGATPEALLCDNETNAELLFGAQNTALYPKDGIGDHVVHGTPTVNPALTGTKGALHYTLTLEPGETRQLRLWLADTQRTDDQLPDHQATHSARASEADEFYREVGSAAAAGAGPAEDLRIMRQAYAGLIWSKQYYHFDVHRWRAGDPAQPLPPEHRGHDRNASWSHFWARDILLMPDPWEYPWFAAWDLAFHCVAMADIDPGFAKDQLYTFLSQRYMKPNGQIPAYEWDFDDVNPPVLAWAALQVYRANGKDHEFLRACFHKLLLNFTYWVNRKDEGENDIFEGGFLGLDNIGVFDRSNPPVEGVLEQSDGTGWMAFFSLSMLEISIELALHEPIYEEMAVTFMEHYAYVAVAINECGLWNEEDGFFYDQLSQPGRPPTIMRVRSMVGVVPLLATLRVEYETVQRLPRFARHLAEFTTRRPEYARAMSRRGAAEALMFSLVTDEQLDRVRARLADPAEFRSPYGLRSLSKYHQEHPFTADLAGTDRPQSPTTVDYEPGESRSGLFGGNSNWRGPVWFPLNYLLIDAAHRSHAKAEHRELAGQLREGLISLFRAGPDGRRPVLGGAELFQTDPRWSERPWFYEYFHGDTGAGLGAAHQTGWTALVATLIHSPNEDRAGG
jgi:Glycosyl hydrolase family 63 C-terminal domain